MLLTKLPRDRLEKLFTGGKVAFPSEGMVSFYIDRTCPSYRGTLLRLQKAVNSDRELTIASLNLYRSGSRLITELELVGTDDFRVFYPLMGNKFVLK